jgi:archaellum component FlaF (FlaF/FlaG flagellin family)
MTEDKFYKAFEEIEKEVDRILESPDKEDLEYIEYRKGAISEINVTRAWLKILFKRNKKSLYYSTAAAAVVLLMSVLIFAPTKDESVIDSMIVQEIMPADGSVTLQLASGKIVDLSSTDNAKELSGGVVLDTKGGEISYEGITNDNDDETILDQSAEMPNEYNELSTPKGRSFSIVLNDGSRIWLNAQSKIKYPVRFGKSERRIQIAGEAFFDVKHDPQRPFIVETTDYSVKVLGTKFNVNAYDQEESSATTLISGSVLIPMKTGIENVLTPGDQLKYSRSDKSISIQKVDVELYTSWIDNNLRIEQMSLEEIFKILMRRYDINVYYSDDISKSEKFSGKIPLNDNLKIVLDQMSKVSNVDFQFEKNLVVVKYKVSK